MPFFVLILLSMPSYQSYTLTEAIKKMERYCAYQERCHKEVRSKLQEMRMIPEAIDHILAHLIQNNYLNEERYAQHFARGKFRIKKWGHNRILKELRQRDISQYAINSALKEISEEEYLAVFSELAEKRWRQLTDDNLQKKKRKFVDYLLYRGWESTLIYPKVEELSGKV